MTTTPPFAPSPQHADLAAEPGGPASASTTRGSRAVIAALYLVCLAELARTLPLTDDPVERLWYVALLGGFIVIFTACWWRRMPDSLRLTLFAAQCVIVLVALSLDPHKDWITALYVVLSYQAVVVFTGRARWVTVGLCVTLAGIPLAWFLGLRGLALAMTPMAVAIVLPAYALARDELETARTESARMVDDLATTNRRLEAYASEVEALAGMEERNRLARELHDSVSQTLFSVQLLTSSAQMLLQTDSDATRAQLERLQELTKNALSTMRGLIADLDGGRGQD